MDAFAEAYLAVLGAELDEDGIYKIRDNRIINLYGTDDAKDILVQFLQKPTADGTQENLLDRLEQLIYRTSMVSDISDETFGSATSGTALAFKLLPMSNLAAGFDRKYLIGTHGGILRFKHRAICRKMYKKKHRLLRNWKALYQKRRSYLYCLSFRTQETK